VSGRGRRVRECFFPVRPAARLAGLETGTGTSVLLVHGSVGDMTEFRRPMAALAIRHHVVAYSRRFHPPNVAPSPGDRYSMALHAGDLAQVLQQTGPAHVIGISWGGYAALVAAMESPGLFRSLVLAEPPVLPLLGGSEAGRRYLEGFLESAIRPAREAFRSGSGERGLALFMDGILGKTGNFDVLPAVIRNELNRFIPELALELTSPFDEYMPDLSSERLRDTRVPTLLLEGCRSPAMFALILDALQSLLPQCSREKILDAGHAIHLSNPGGFLQRVQTFLQSREGGDPAARG
jgi:pimeloyl-ACP methyl ester carboxylesterase